MEILLSRHMHSQMNTKAGFADDLAELFHMRDSNEAIATRGLEGHGAARDNARRADFEARWDHVPKADSLPRPEILLPSLRPYHIIIEARSDKITVHANHQPSLELLATYLRKHIRSTDNTKDKVGSPTTQPMYNPFSVSEVLILGSNHVSKSRPIRPILGRACCSID